MGSLIEEGTIAMTNEQPSFYPSGQPETGSTPMTSTGTETETGQTGRRADEARQRVAGGLDRAASTLRDRAGAIPGGQRMQGAARNAADRLQSAASYVRDHDMSQMTDEARQVVKRNPGGSLLAACAAGFVIGFMLRRR